MKEGLEAKLLKSSLYIIFSFVLAAMAAAPVLEMFMPRVLTGLYVSVLADGFFYAPGYRLFMLLFFEAVGFLGLWIIGEMILLMRSIPNGPFVRRNVKALRRIGRAALLVSLLFFIKCVLFITILTFICGILLIICACFAFTLASLINQAVIYKEENDLTI